VRRFALRLVGALVVTAVVGFAFAVIPSVPTSEKEYEISDARISVQLQRDGSLIVRESLPFDFTGSFTGAYRDFPLNGSARVTDAAVSENGEKYRPGANTALGSSGVPGSFGTENRQNGYRIVWHYDQNGGTRTFDLVYRVVDAATIHDDVVDVSWTVWGDQWDFWLNDLNAEISAQSGVAPEQAWLRPRSLGADVEVGDAATVSVDRVPEGENVGFRAVFPRDAISSTGGAEVESGKGLPAIEDEEASLDDDYGFVDKLENAVVDNVVAISLIISALALLATLALALRARERDTGVPHYLPEPPEDISPAVAYALAAEGDYDERVVLATLMDLVDRGYFEARPSAGSDLDLELRKLGERGERRSKLEQHEIAVLDFFDLLVEDDWVALGAMKDRVPAHSTTWRNRWEAMNGYLEDAEDGQINWDLDLRGRRAAITLLTVIALGLVIVLAYSRTHLIGIPATALVGTLLLMHVPPSNSLRRLDPAARERNERWTAFKRWTEDFPRLDDDPPATLKLWRRILVYAVAFGTAERVAKSGRIPAPVGEEAASSGVWTSYAIGAGFGHSFGGFSSGFASQVAPEASSSGPGGFSGGGGGGFSGGGGGGAW
jgi:uncharacterized membrane protein